MREKVVKGAKKQACYYYYLYSLFPEKWDCLDLGHGEWKIEKNSAIDFKYVL